MANPEKDEQKATGDFGVGMVVRLDTEADTSTFVTMTAPSGKSAVQAATLRQLKHDLANYLDVTHIRINRIGVKSAEDNCSEPKPRAKPRRDPPPAVRSPMHRAIDWFPSPRTRKVLGKLVADQDALIADLDREGRTSAATWQRGITWVLLLYTGALHLISSLANAVRGSRKAS